MAGLIEPLPVANFPGLINQGLRAFQGVRGIQQQQAKLDRQEQIRRLSQGVENDPQKLAKLATLDPQRALNIQQFQTGKTRESREQGQFDRETQERFRRESVDLAAELEGQPLPNQLALVNRQITKVQNRGGDASDTIRLRNLLAGNPEENNQAQAAISQRRVLGERLGFLKPAAQPKPESRTPLAKNLDLLSPEDLSQEERKQIILNNLSGSQQRIEMRPDGSFIFASGKGVGAGGSQKKTVTDLEKRLVTFEQNISDLERIEEQVDPEFLTFMGRGKAFFSGLKSKAGIALSPKDKQFVQKRRAFTQNVNRFFNNYRRDITGAAASVQELNGLKKAMFTEDLSPVEFEAAFNEFKDSVFRSRRLIRKLHREGVRGDLRNKKSQAAKRFDSEFTAGGDDSPEDRAAELEAQGIPDEQIEQTLINEGYAF